MRILIDMSSVHSKNLFSSIPIYIMRFLDHIPSTENLQIILLVNLELKFYMKKRYPHFEQHFLYRNYLFYRFPFIHSFYGRFTYKKALSKIEYDYEWIASDFDRSITMKTNKKRIVVIHDLKGLKDGSIAYKIRNFYYYRKLMQSATKIIAISTFTQQDILKHFQIKASKIHVIYNSVTLASQKTKVLNWPTQQPYILFVNTLLPYKNPLVLIKAFSKIQNECQHHLIFIGKKNRYWNKVLLKTIHKLNLQNRVHHLENLSPEELHYAYDKASLFVSPSKREGFGYTPIEAAMAKTPVLCSKSEALPDTTQSLLEYYEPTDDYLALSQALLYSLQNPPSKEKLNAISKQFQKDYSPQLQNSKILHLFYQLKEKSL